jgi:uncharacterized protein (DUF1697 family)
MPTFISLLRGINVVGNKKIKMEALRALYQSLNLANPRTLLQSGNAVFQTDLIDERQLAKHIEDGIEQTFGFHSKIFIRTLDQFRAVVENHPYSPDQLTDPAKLLVMFFETTPESIETLLSAHTGPETFHLKGRELYITYPDGMGRSKLSNVLIEKKLKLLGTGRNWNTVTKLLILAASS